jgi:hypothetical protein
MLIGAVKFFKVQPAINYVMEILIHTLSGLIIVELKTFDYGGNVTFIVLVEQIVDVLGVQ